MSVVSISVLLFAAAVAGIGLFLAAPPGALAGAVRRLPVLALFALVALAASFGQFALAGLAGALGLGLWWRARGRGPKRRPGPPSRAPERRVSAFRTAGLEMTLDRVRGRLDGVVLAGRYVDRPLSDLSADEILDMARDFRGDVESLRLLEAYLDRLHAGWRHRAERDRAAFSGTPTGAGGMSLEEAYRVLGLRPGAGEAEIREAHRRLLEEAHAERGASALAAKINEAKNRLLDKHG